MVDGIYVLKDENPLFVYTEDQASNDAARKILAPFLAAVNLFTNKNLGGKIKSLIIDEMSGFERYVYFKDFRIGDESYLMIVILSRSIGRHCYGFWEVTQRIGEFLAFLKEKGWLHYLIEDEVEAQHMNEIEKKIIRLFDFRQNRKRKLNSFVLKA
ncbi:MAG: hypothetical protein ACTSVI_13645 [Promethearchaeota archaeon]